VYATTKFRDLDFVLTPDLVSVYGAVTPAWKKLDMVEKAEIMIDYTVERELMMTMQWRPRRRVRPRRFVTRRRHG